jgi:type I restriction enzyme S subunit
LHYCQTLKPLLVHLAPSTTVPIINKSRFQDLQIPLPPLPEQKRIAAILDKADAIRRKRQQAVKLTEELLRSVFLDMFGDPVTNLKGWETGVLGDVIFSAKDGPHVSPEYSIDGIPFLSARHVKPGRIEWNDLKHIALEEAKIHWRKCKPEIGDILYTKGGTTGVAAVFDSDKEIAVWVHIALLKLNHNKVNPYWLENMLNSKYCYDQSQRYTHGITNQDLGLKRMVNIEIYIPPLSEQNRFHAVVQKIMNITSMNSSILQESENVFNSLLQHAFKGEL